MTERPILFSGPMVRALLTCTKSQTRRIAKFKTCEPGLNMSFSGLDPAEIVPGVWTLMSRGAGGAWSDRTEPLRCPYGEPGDQLWVRETWARPTTIDPGPTIYRADYPACVPPYYENIPPVDEVVWRPSIHMPRTASRIYLEITGIRAERLQSISESDATAEGVTMKDHHKLGYCSGEFLPPAVRAFRDLWESINGAGSWHADPWVWVVEFKNVTSNKGNAA